MGKGAEEEEEGGGGGGGVGARVRKSSWRFVGAQP